MRDDQKRRVLGAVDALHQVEDLAAVLAIQAAGGLIGQHQPRTLGQGAGNRYPLLFSAGELAGVLIGSSRKPDPRQQLIGSLAALPAVQTQRL